MLVNQVNLDAMSRSFKVLFMAGLNSTEVKYPKIAEVVPSSTKSNTYADLGAMPKLREWAGDRVVKALSEFDYTITNKSFESTIGVDRDDIEDDNIGIYSNRFTGLGLLAKQHPDKLLFDLIKAGETTLCYDGQPYFDTEHPVANGLVSNFDSGAGTAWYLLATKALLKPFIVQMRRKPELTTLDRSTDPNVFHRKQYLYGVDYRGNVGFGLWQLAYKSTQTLDSTHYNSARAAMMSITDDEGEPMDIMPDVLMVPPSLEETARKLLLAEQETAGATNVWKGTAEVMIVPRLAA